MMVHWGLPASQPPLPPPTQRGRTVPRWMVLDQLSEAELSAFDIALVDLLCTYGMPGFESIDIAFCLKKLDEWAEIVRAKTNEWMYRYDREPANYNNSRNYFRILALITALQRDLGVKYNPDKIPDDAPFDTADTFIHGIIQGNGGTCATLPVSVRCGWTTPWLSIEAGGYGTSSVLSLE